MTFSPTFLADLQNRQDVNILIPGALSPDSARLGAPSLVRCHQMPWHPVPLEPPPPQEPWENFPHWASLHLTELDMG